MEKKPKSPTPAPKRRSTAAAGKAALPATSDMDALSAQLDDLLSRVEEQESKLVEMVGEASSVDAAAVSTAPSPKASSATDAEARADGATQTDMDQLAGQIEQLLSDTKSVTKSDDDSTTADSGAVRATTDDASEARDASDAAAASLTGDELADQVQALLDEASQAAAASDADGDDNVAAERESEDADDSEDFAADAFMSLDTFMAAVAEDDAAMEAENAAAACEGDTALAAAAAPADIAPLESTPSDGDTGSMDLLASVQAALGFSEPSSASSSASGKSAAEAMAHDEADADDAATGDAPPPAQTISAIDEYIAEQADDLLGGDFETVHEAIGAAPPNDAARAGDLTPQHHVSGAIDPDDLDVDAFATPDEVLRGVKDDVAPARSVAEAFDASAADVASELDDQPEQRKNAADDASAPAHEEKDATAPDNLEAVTPEADKAGKRRLGGLLASMIVAAGRVGLEATYRTCALLNRPLQRLSPQSRHVVGYFAILHVFVGSAILMSKIAAALFSK